MDPTIASRIEELEENGFVLLPGALTPEEVETCRVAINEARANGWQEGLNHVGNMWFDHLLEQNPEVFTPLIAHPSVRPYLETLLGPQCQLRSLRAHINPGAYKQEWHMDFYGYWSQPTARYAVKGVGINTTFYFQDNGPGIAYLTFIKGGHRMSPPGDVLVEGRRTSEEEFNAWGDAQEHITIYPKAGDVVLFFSHIPHRGAKEDPQVERSNVVCHYQGNPFYPGLPHVSSVYGASGVFPLAGARK
jgi:ectoine hydroxylase-related dioxygenase (phytanoyl-CoA dioxygenase family)